MNTTSRRRAVPAPTHPTRATAAPATGLDVNGWGGRIRTFEYGIQSPAPYRLATPQYTRGRACPSAPPVSPRSGRAVDQPATSGRPQTRKFITGPAGGPASRLESGPRQQHEPVRPLQPRDRPAGHRLRKHAKNRRSAARHRRADGALPQAGLDHLADRRVAPRHRAPARSLAKATGPWPSPARPRALERRAGRRLRRGPRRASA